MAAAGVGLRAPDRSPQAISACRATVERPALSITGYVIDAELDTATHHLSAKTVVTFTAPENLELVSFGFHPALKVTKITDENGKVLTGERIGGRNHPRDPGRAVYKGQLSTGPSSTRARLPATRTARWRG